MNVELFCWNELRGLSENRPKGTTVQFTMMRNRERLTLTRQSKTEQFHMTTTLRVNPKTELPKDRDDFIA